MFVLTSPKSYAGYTPKVIIHTEKVDMNYNSYYMEKEAIAQVEAIGKNGFKEFSYPGIYQREFINYNSTYTSYVGVTEDDVQVGGVVIVACEDKTLYVLNVSFPQEFGRTYVYNVYDVIRDTAKTIE